MSGYVPPPIGDPGTGVVPETANWIDNYFFGPVKEAAHVIQKMVVFTWDAMVALFKLIIKVFEGTVYPLFGSAPYITLPALLVVPFQVSFPGATQFFFAPLTFLGVSDSAIFAYEFFGVSYWILLVIYNVWMGEELALIK